MLLQINNGDGAVVLVKVEVEEEKRDRSMDEVLAGVRE